MKRKYKNISKKIMKYTQIYIKLTSNSPRVQAGLSNRNRIQEPELGTHKLGSKAEEWTESSSDSGYRRRGYKPCVPSVLY